MSDRQALLHVQMKTLEGTEAIKKIIREISTEGQVMTISSIYRHRNDESPNDLETPIEFVLLYVTEKTAFDLKDFLNVFPERVPRRREGDLKITLLSYDADVLMTPEMTLPHPSLHANPLVCRCASEVWGDYEHPVLKKKLSKIASASAPVTNAEFWMQGQSRVDF